MSERAPEPPNTTHVITPELAVVVNNFINPSPSSPATEPLEADWSSDAYWGKKTPEDAGIENEHIDEARKKLQDMKTAYELGPDQIKKIGRTVAAGVVTAVLVYVKSKY